MQKFRGFPAGPVVRSAEQNGATAAAALWLLPTIPPKHHRLQFVRGVSSSLRRKTRKAKTAARYESVVLDTYRCEIVPHSVGSEWIVASSETSVSWQGRCVMSQNFPSTKTERQEAGSSTHHPQTRPQRAKIALWGPRRTFGAPFAQNDNPSLWRALRLHTSNSPTMTRRARGWRVETRLLPRSAGRSDSRPANSRRGCEGLCAMG